MLIHLHIGIDKAGSSAIQSNMKLNREWFQRHRAIFIPNFGLATTGYWQVFRDLSVEAFEEVCKELKYAAGLGFEHAFMSWEGINTYSAEQIRTLRHRLRDHEVKIYVYLREQAEVIQSGYFQQVKTEKEGRFLSEFHENPSLLCPDVRDYAAMLGRFAKVFGENSINVRVFDRNLLKRNNVVLDMLDMMGLEPDEHFSLRPGEDNPSLDMASVKIMNLLDEALIGNQWGGATYSGVLSAQQSSDILQRQGAAILDLYYGESTSGRKDIVDILLNIIDMEGKVEKYFLSAAECKLIESFYAHSNREVVARFLGENWPNPELFSYSKRPSIDASGDSLDSVIPERLDAILSTGHHRTWNGVPLEGNGLATIAAKTDGWNNTTEAGVWCNATQSTLRFRVTWKHINFMHSKLALVSNAQASKKYENSTIFVNGQNLGEFDLRRARIEIPLTLLRPLGLVDIEMQHHFASLDGSIYVKSEFDKAGFTLTLFKYGLR